MGIGRQKKHKYKSYDDKRQQDKIQSTNDTTTKNYEFSVGDKQDFSFRLAEKNPHQGGKTASIEINLNTDADDAENSRPPLRGTVPDRALIDLIGEESDLDESDGSVYGDEESVSDEEIELEEDEEWVEDEIMYSTFGKDNKVLSSKSNKIGVAFHYMNVLDAEPEDLWDGADGIINRILVAINLKNKGYYGWVRDILRAVRVCIIKNIEYTGQGIKKRRGFLPTLTIKSKEAKIVAATMEKSLGIRHATQRVNTYRIRMNLGILGES